ncbi:MAG: AAA family ATPase, partial [bacterium]|nr:AAA family ATPase [bacterium]
MRNSVVRLNSIEIKNFKNVAYGALDFENPRKPYSASILGLYGQNGSGKTALIDSLLLLKLALSGQSAPAYFADLISVDADHAEIKYELKVTNTETNGAYCVLYDVCIRKDVIETESNTVDLDGEDYKVTLFDERLSYSYECGGTKCPNRPVVDTRTEDVFVPKAKYDALVGKSKSVFTDLLVAKKLALSTSRAFVFSKEMLSAVRSGCSEEYHRFLFESLSAYGNYELFVINTASAGFMSMNALPLAFRSSTKDASFNNIMLNISGTTAIPAEAYKPVE